MAIVFVDALSRRDLMIFIECVDGGARAENRIVALDIQEGKKVKTGQDDAAAFIIEKYSISRVRDLLLKKRGDFVCGGHVFFRALEPFGMQPQKFRRFGFSPEGIKRIHVGHS